jgi:hypothetical protein
MRPLIAPVVCCAAAGTASSHTVHSAIIDTMTFFMPDGLPIEK